jgi:hypothetical protein
MSTIFQKIGVILFLGAAVAMAKENVDPGKTIDPDVLAESVAKLKNARCIKNEQYWLDNAQPGKFIPTAEVRTMVIAVANKYKKVKSIEEAIDVLKEAKVMNDIESWQSNLLNKDQMAGGVAAFLIVVMAKAAK